MTPASGCAKNLPDGDTTTDYLSVFLSRPPVKRLKKIIFFNPTYQFGGFFGGHSRKVSVYFYLKKRFQEGIDMIMNSM